MQKFLFQPVKPFHINQRFGEKNACINIATNKVISVTNGVCPAGYHSLYGAGGHSGIDLKAKRWQPIYASQSGTVVEVSTEEPRGLGVRIVTDQKYYFKETNSLEYAKYGNWHFIALNVHMGEHVKTGDLLGYADSTGYSTGDHDHFDLKPVEKFGDVYINILHDNGTYGAVDPLPYTHNIFALDIKDINMKLKKIREQLAILVDMLSDWLRKSY